MMIARKVLISMSALPRERSCTGSNSGSELYFAGEKKAEWVAIRKMITSMSGTLPIMNATSASTIATTSTLLVAISTERLVNVSASWPA